MLLGVGVCSIAGAVKDTYGIVPVYDGSVIVPMYFSTSCGTTCTNEEIWGGTPYPYLQSNVETVNKESIDLSSEDAFIQFIKDSNGYDIIDKDMLKNNDFEGIAKLAKKYVEALV